MSSPPRNRPPRARSASPSRPPRDAALPDGLAARSAALALVEAALARRGGLESATHEPGFAGLEPRDRAFARALSGAVLRRLGALDRLLDAKLNRAPPDAVRGLLRIGLAQMAVLETPAFAAVSTTLALAERRSETRPFRGLINAVLRGLDREGATAQLAALGPEADAPEWLVARWRAAYGEETAAAILAAVRVEPPTDLTLRDPADAPALAAELEGEVLPTGGVRTPRRGDPAAWPGYAEGCWWVQDAAAALPVLALDPKPGETALDMCAAPGGKTLQLAAMGARVTALDKAAHRLERLAQNFARMGLAAEIVTADAAGWDDPRSFDAVLLDAPCSATGTFRRRPDVLWASRTQDVAQLSVVQARLLDAAAARTAPGGRLVYCVCSLEPEEGEAQARAFLSRHANFRATSLDPARFDLPAQAAAEGGALRVLPSFWRPRGGLDGFYIARFDRTALSRPHRLRPERHHPSPQHPLVQPPLV